MEIQKTFLIAGGAESLPPAPIFFVHRKGSHLGDSGRQRSIELKLSINSVTWPLVMGLTTGPLAAHRAHGRSPRHAGTLTLQGHTDTQC